MTEIYLHIVARMGAFLPPQNNSYLATVRRLPSSCETPALLPFSLPFPQISPAFLARCCSTHQQPRLFIHARLTLQAYLIHCGVRVGSAWFAGQVRMGRYVYSAPLAEADDPPPPPSGARATYPNHFFFFFDR